MIQLQHGEPTFSARALFKGPPARSAQLDNHHRPGPFLMRQATAGHQIESEIGHSIDLDLFFTDDHEMKTRLDRLFFLSPPLSNFACDLVTRRDLVQ